MSRGASTGDECFPAGQADPLASQLPGRGAVPLRAVSTADVHTALLLVHRHRHRQRMVAGSCLVAVVAVPILLMAVWLSGWGRTVSVDVRPANQPTPSDSTTVSTAPVRTPSTAGRGGQAPLPTSSSTLPPASSLPGGPASIPRNSSRGGLTMISPSGPATPPHTSSASTPLPTTTVPEPTIPLATTSSSGVGIPPSTTVLSGPPSSSSATAGP